MRPFGNRGPPGSYRMGGGPFPRHGPPPPPFGFGPGPYGPGPRPMGHPRFDGPRPVRGPREFFMGSVPPRPPPGMPRPPGLSGPSKVTKSHVSANAPDPISDTGSAGRDLPPPGVKKEPVTPSPSTSSTAAISSIGSKESTSSSPLVKLDEHNSDIYLDIDESGLKAVPKSKNGFEYLWSGVRATHGVVQGKVCYEVHVLENLPVDLPTSEGSPNVLRVGWSIDSPDLHLGETELSYGYGGTGKSSHAGKFTNYGRVFGPGDRILCCVDYDVTPHAVFFTLNGDYLGLAYRVGPELQGKPLFPHVYSKNVSFEVNFGTKPPTFPPPPGFTMMQGASPKEVVPGPAVKGSYEILTMVGLPACGKSTWVENYVKDHHDKRYTVLGTNLILDKMRITGLGRKRNYHGRWDALIKQATEILNEMFKIAEVKRRNYILDQTNVYVSARRRKLKSFEGYRRIAAVIVNKPSILQQRLKLQLDEGKVVPESAIMEMKANFTLPTVDDVFHEVWYLEENEAESAKLVESFRQEGLQYKRTAGGAQDSKDTASAGAKRPRIETSISAPVPSRAPPPSVPAETKPFPGARDRVQTQLSSSSRPSMPGDRMPSSSTLPGSSRLPRGSSASSYGGDSFRPPPAYNDRHPPHDIPDQSSYTDKSYYNSDRGSYTQRPVQPAEMPMYAADRSRYEADRSGYVGDRPLFETERSGHVGPPSQSPYDSRSAPRQSDKYVFGERQPSAYEEQLSYGDSQLSYYGDRMHSSSYGSRQPQLYEASAKKTSTEYPTREPYNLPSAEYGDRRGDYSSSYADRSQQYGSTQLYSDKQSPYQGYFYSDKSGQPGPSSGLAGTTATSVAAREGQDMSGYALDPHLGSYYKTETGHSQLDRGIGGSSTLPSAYGGSEGQQYGLESNSFARGYDDYNTSRYATSFDRYTDTKGSTYGGSSSAAPSYPAYSQVQSYSGSVVSSAATYLHPVSGSGSSAAAPSGYGRSYTHADSDQSWQYGSQSSAYGYPEQQQQQRSGYSSSYATGDPLAGAGASGYGLGASAQQLQGYPDTTGYTAAAPTNQKADYLTGAYSGYGGPPVGPQQAGSGWYETQQSVPPGPSAGGGSASGVYYY